MSPLEGLVPFLARRVFFENTPKPDNLTSFPLINSFSIMEIISSTAFSASPLDKFALSATSKINSALSYLGVTGVSYSAGNDVSKAIFDNLESKLK